jgi:hypothetical protein
MSVLKYLQEALNQKKQSFVIPESIASNFKIVGGLDNYKNWKVKVLMANSAKEGVKKGQWENPGYVMISLDSNNIIPIARSDEHQTGYDLLEDYYYKKKLIKRENYISIYGIGNTYLYGDGLGVSDNSKDDMLKIEGFKRWLSYGGLNNPVQNPYSTPRYIGDMEDVINNNGKFEIIKGKIHNNGSKIIDALEYISREYLKFVNLDQDGKEPREEDVDKLIEYTIDFLSKFKDFNSPIGELVFYDVYGMLDRNDPDKYIRSLTTALQRHNWKTVGDIILSSNGVKNKLHNAIRSFKDKEYKKLNGNGEKYVAIFGDLEKAFLEFNRLGNIK